MKTLTPEEYNALRIAASPTEIRMEDSSTWHQLRTIFEENLLPSGYIVIVPLSETIGNYYISSLGREAVKCYEHCLNHQYLY